MAGSVDQEVSMNMDPEMPVDDDVFVPTKILMNAGDWCDIVAWGLVEDGWSEEAAREEAQCRLEALQLDTDRDLEEIGNLMAALH
jgi:hypothetical protein